MTVHQGRAVKITQGAHWGKDFSNIDSVQLCNKSIHSR